MENLRQPSGLFIVIYMCTYADGMQMCTFAPKLNKRALLDEWVGSVIERSEAWQARREQKLHEAREHDADKDLEGCTFW